MMYELKGKETNAKIMIDVIDEATESQIRGFLGHPAFTNPIAIMPDCHKGKGSCIGFTMELGDKLIPNLIGVDIGCGMLSVNIGKELGNTFEKIDKSIRKNIPLGFKVRKAPIKLSKEDKDRFENLAKKVDCNVYRMECSLGSLGGGNHFIELGQDQNEDYWITIHTGSRNLGKCVCDYHQTKAINNVEAERERYMTKSKNEILNNPNIDKKDIQTLLDKAKNNFGVSCREKPLRYLTGNDATEYLEDMKIAQEYASLNRKSIMESILWPLGWKEQERIESVHNFIDFEDNIIRKGAIRSYKGEKMIIPFNMRDGILICEGKSNPEWNCSAPHGAGRVLSRNQARENLKLEDFEETMKGIYSTSVCKGTLDESPMAYKDSKIIEEAITPTATIINRIKPILNIKANN